MNLQTITNLLTANKTDKIRVQPFGLVWYDYSVENSRPDNVRTFLVHYGSNSYPTIYKQDLQILLEEIEKDGEKDRILEYITLITSAIKGSSEADYYIPFPEHIIFAGGSGINYGIYKYVTDICCQKTNTYLPDYRIPHLDLPKDVIIKQYNEFIDKDRKEADLAIELAPDLGEQIILLT